MSSPRKRTASQQQQHQQQERHELLTTAATPVVVGAEHEGASGYATRPKKKSPPYTPLPESMNATSNPYKFVNKNYYKRKTEEQGTSTATKPNKENAPPAAAAALQFDVVQQPQAARGDNKTTKHHKHHHDEHKSHRKSHTVDEQVLAQFGYKLLPSGQNLLGSGRYSRVRLAQDMRIKDQMQRDPEGLVAIKVINTQKVSRDFNQKFLPRELDIWGQLAHPNLVRMLAQFKYGHFICMAMEYVPNGDLLSFVQKYGELPESTVRYWLWQLIDAVRYMHSVGVAHRDLKLENILINSDNNMKIADFGFCRWVDREEGVHGEMSQTYCGSKSYSCPEILRGVPYCPLKADVWSLGVIGYIMTTNKMPFDEHVPNNATIVEAQRLRAYKYSKRTSHELKSMLDEMMSFNQSERPTLTMVTRHVWWLKQLGGTSSHTTNTTVTTGTTSHSATVNSAMY